MGGRIANGVWHDQQSISRWWGSEAKDSIAASRYLLGMDGSNLTSSSGSRLNGLYIRCVSEEKTATDLTYMQDMTPEIFVVK